MLHEIKTKLLRTESNPDDPWPAERDDAPESRQIREQPTVDGGDSTRAPREPTAEDHDELPVDHVFGILGDEQRRYALACMSRGAAPVTTTELAERVAACEYEKSPERLTARERERVQVRLQRAHLPKLDAVAAVSYDRERGVVEPGGRFPQFVRHLRHGV